MLYLAYDAEAESRKNEVSADAEPVIDQQPEPKNQLEVVLESLVESLEDLNVSMARAYIDSIERKRAAAAERQRSK